MSEPRDPLDQILDLAVYAPVGLVLLARDQLPGLVERGRGTVLGQVRLARFIGQFAVAKGRQELERRLTEAVNRPGPSAPTPAAPPTPAASAAPDPAPPAAVVVVSDDAADHDLPIEGYEALAASQVVGRLAGLGPDDLELIRRHESAHRARRTVLTRIAQLQGGGA